MDIYQDIRQVLIDNAETCYKNFLIKLIPNCSNILGVRIPFLRKIAKQICSNNWQSYIYHNPIFLEETLLQAIIIGKKSQTISDFNNIKNFIPKITNWAICDTFCSSLKFIKSNKDYCLIFLKPYLSSSKEFELRFGLVILLNYFIEEKYLPLIFKTLDSFKNNQYYAQMAAAWLLSSCFIKFPNRTLIYLKKSQLDKTTYNKSIQKIIESQQVDKSLHSLLKRMKRLS